MMFEDELMDYVNKGLYDVDFSIPESFLSKYRGKNPDWDPMAYFTFKRTYARRLPRTDFTENEWKKIKKSLFNEYPMIFNEDTWDDFISIFNRYEKQFNDKNAFYEKFFCILKNEFNNNITRDVYRGIRDCIDKNSVPKTEEFFDTVKRVVEGVFRIQKYHQLKNRYTWNEEIAIHYAEVMFEKIWNFKFLPPGRGLWYMNTEHMFRHGSAALNNCAFITTKEIGNISSRTLNCGSFPFRWAMDMLMLGVGVGFDTKGAGSTIIKKPKFINKTFVIPDSREGWWIAVGMVLDPFFFDDNDLIALQSNRRHAEPIYRKIPIFDGIPKFDFSKIRPKGSIIRGFGGTASGPEPLQKLIEGLINLYTSYEGKYIDSTLIVDTMNMIASCVIAGNVRRSAEISIGDINDDEYLRLKHPEVLESLPDWRNKRWASNNSVIAHRGSDYSKIAKLIVESNGEPGVIWIENAKKYGRMNEIIGDDPKEWKDPLVEGTNPCGEQSLSSGELCCLVEIFPSKHTGGKFIRWNKEKREYEEVEMSVFDELKETAKYAYMYAKTITLLSTHWELSNDIMHRNHRIGISQSGIIDAFHKFGRSRMLEWSDKLYRYLRQLDDKWSDEWFHCPRSNKITTVKPSGTISLLAGVSPGIHYPHSKYYIRRIRASIDSDIAKVMIKAGIRAELDKYDKFGRTIVLEFPVKLDVDKTKYDVSIWEQVANAIDYQKYWSDNQVSITVTFKEYEADQIESVLQFCEDKLKGITFLKLEDDTTYPQMPYQAITKEEYEQRMSEISSDIDLSNIKELANGKIEVSFCDGSTGKCKVVYEDDNKSIPKIIDLVDTIDNYSVFKLNTEDSKK